MDSEMRTHKRLRLMVDMLERKIRLRARQLYEQRGRQEGKALEDWITAEVDILRCSILAQLWSAGRLLEVVQNPSLRQSYSKHDLTGPEQAVVEKTRSIGRIVFGTSRSGRIAPNLVCGEKEDQMLKSTSTCSANRTFSSDPASHRL